jgi:hypothetical protein
MTESVVIFTSFMEFYGDSCVIYEKDPLKFQFHVVTAMQEVCRFREGRNMGSAARPVRDKPIEINGFAFGRGDNGDRQHSRQ